MVVGLLGRGTCDPRSLQQEVPEYGAFDAAAVVQSHFHELAETRRIIIADSFCVTYNTKSLTLLVDVEITKRFQFGDSVAKNLATSQKLVATVPVVNIYPLMSTKEYIHPGLPVKTTTPLSAGIGNKIGDQNIPRLTPVWTPPFAGIGNKTGDQNIPRL